MALNPIALPRRRASRTYRRGAWIVAALAFLAVMLPLPARAGISMIDLAKSARLDPEQMVAALSKADIILIGEHHGNPAHHRIQTSLIEMLIKVGRRPVLLFEMLAERQEIRYGLYRRNARAGSALDKVQELDDVLEWSVRGWPNLPAYPPLFVLAEAYDLEVGHADLPADLVGNISRYGVAAIPKSLRDRLFGALSAADLQDVAGRLAPVVALAHGMKPNDPTAGGLIAAQLAKDAYMALRLSGQPRPVVLIAGVEHVRTDVGVPLHLAKRGFAGKVLSISVPNEARDGIGPDGNDLARAGIKPPFDWIWLGESLGEKK